MPSLNTLMLLLNHQTLCFLSSIFCLWGAVCMGGDQCQNLQIFLFSIKIICMVKFYIQMTHYLSFAPWSSTYKWYSLICMVKFYIQMILAHLHGEVLHTNDTRSFAWWSSTYKWYSLICMVLLLYWKPLLFFPEKRDLPATRTQRRDTIITSI